MADVIVTAPGSLGDVHPMLGLALELRRAGKEVVFAAAERYLKLASAVGLATHPLIREEEFQKLLRHPDLWHPRRGIRQIFGGDFSRSLLPHYRWLEQQVIPGRTMLVSHFLDFAGRTYREVHPKTRMISVLLAPSLLRSVASPSRWTARGWECLGPRWMRPIVFRMADRVIDRIANRAMQPLRKELGLQSARSVLGSWWRSPDGAVGLFPSWFAPSASDTIDPLPLFGFPLLDDHPEEDTAEKLRLEGWLAAAPRRPIVFAPGSANEQASEYFRMAIEAARRLERPALLLSSNPKGNLPERLPDHVAASTYLPLSWLLPRCEGLVHHGGVGTTSQALATGTPQTIVAMAFDQFDNGLRVEALGCGNWLPRRHATVDRLVEAIGRWKKDDCRKRALDLAREMSDDPMVSEQSIRYSSNLRRAAEFVLADGGRKAIA